MRAEYDALLQNGTFKLVPLPKDHTVIKAKWTLRAERYAMAQLTATRPDG